VSRFVVFNEKRLYHATVGEIGGRETVVEFINWPAARDRGEETGLSYYLEEISFKR